MEDIFVDDADALLEEYEQRPIYPPNFGPSDEDVDALLEEYARSNYPVYPPDTDEGNSRGKSLKRARTPSTALVDNVEPQFPQIIHSRKSMRNGCACLGFARVPTWIEQKNPRFWKL